MKLTHDIEAQKKGPEDKADDKKGFSKSPLTDKLMGRVLAIALAASAPAAIIATTASSCTFQPAGFEAEDGGADAAQDGGADGGHDAGPDIDAGPDADAGPDLDAGPDADVDGGFDAGPDADVDGGEPDGGPVACPGTIAENYNGVINSGVPQEVGNYNFEYVNNAGGDSNLNILCGVTPIELGVAFPVGVMTPYDRTVDGLEIQVTPTNVAPTWTLITINVVTHP